MRRSVSPSPVKSSNAIDVAVYCIVPPRLKLSPLNAWSNHPAVRATYLYLTPLQKVWSKARKEGGRSGACGECVAQLLLSCVVKLPQRRQSCAAIREVVLTCRLVEILCGRTSEQRRTQASQSSATRASELPCRARETPSILARRNSHGQSFLKIPHFSVIRLVTEKNSGNCPASSIKKLTQIFQVGAALPGSSPPLCSSPQCVST